MEITILQNSQSQPKVNNLYAKKVSPYHLTTSHRLKSCTKFRTNHASKKQIHYSSGSCPLDEKEIKTQISNICCCSSFGYSVATSKFFLCELEITDRDCVSTQSWAFYTEQGVTTSNGLSFDRSRIQRKYPSQFDKSSKMLYISSGNLPIQHQLIVLICCEESVLSSEHLIRSQKVTLLLSLFVFIEATFFVPFKAKIADSTKVNFA